MSFWFRFLKFFKTFFRFYYTKTRHKIMTQKISYMIHPFPCHIIYSHADYRPRIAINTTN